MKYMFIVRSLTGGGAERVLTLLANKLAETKNDVYILCYSRSVNDYSVSVGVKVIEMPKRKDGLVTKILRINDMRKIFKKINPDIIIPFVGTVVYVSWFARMGMNIKFVLTIRNNPWIIPENKIYHKLRDHIAKKADAIMVQNDEQKKYFVSELRKKIYVVSNPIDEKILDNIKMEYSISPHKILAVGRLNYQKNFSFLINNISDLLIKHPELELDIYGTGEEEEKILGIIKEKKIENKCHLRGRINDISKIIKEYDIFVMTSIFEGMPNALMEAMAVGLPCISSDCLTGPKTLLNNNCGYLYRNGDSEDFKSKLIYVIDNYKNLDKVVTNAKNKIINKYCINKIINDFLYMIKEIEKGK